MRSSEGRCVFWSRWWNTSKYPEEDTALFYFSCKISIWEATSNSSCLINVEGREQHAQKYFPARTEPACSSPVRNTKLCFQHLGCTLWLPVDSLHPHTHFLVVVYQTNMYPGSVCLCLCVCHTAAPCSRWRSHSVRASLGLRGALSEALIQRGLKTCRY